MKTDEFAFFNQQLAAMLRDGIPLEGALQRLCTEMQDAPLRAELQTLAADLAQGVPLPEAIRRRQLPELYRCLVEVAQVLVTSH
ncbi:MAG: type II secretion system F family protein [Verrucomicrobiota bacterium]